MEVGTYTIILHLLTSLPPSSEGPFCARVPVLRRESSPGTDWLGVWELLGDFDSANVRAASIHTRVDIYNYLKPAFVVRRVMWRLVIRLDVVMLSRSKFWV